MRPRTAISNGFRPFLAQIPVALRPFLAQTPVALRPVLAQTPVALRPFLVQAPVALRPFLVQAPVALRANNVRPYDYTFADGLHGGMNERRKSGHEKKDVPF